MANFTGTSGPDLINGTDFDDYIDALGGDDTVHGYAGNDDIYGFTGNDLLYGYDGIDYLFGENGNDSLYGDAHADSLDGGDGHDYLDGGTGNDTLLGGLGNDDLYGWSGNDTLYGSYGIDYLFGEDGGDFLYGEGDADSLDGGDGVDYLYGGVGSDTLLGGLDDDFLYGEDQADTLDGGDGNDYLNGGDDSDSLIGGLGNDTLIDDVDSPFIYGHDTLDSGGGNDFLFGSWGNDSLIGGTGIDLFFDKGGQNTIIGGGGDDLIGFFSEYSAFSFVSLGTGGAGRDYYAWLGDEFDVLFNGWGGFVITDFQPGTGGDYLSVLEFLYLSLQFGFSSPDEFGTGFLYLQEDPFFTYNGITYGGTHLYWDVDGPTGSTPYYNVLTLLGVTYAELTATTEHFVGLLQQGTSQSENLNGGSDGDLLVGREGNDTLDGGVGKDTMVGGAGRDTYHVDNKDDKLNEEFTNGPQPLAEGPPGLDDFTDTVIAVVNYSLSNVDFVEDLTLSSTATEGTGNGLNNTLTGNANANTLNGLGGADTLKGNGGNDTLDGGTGGDEMIGGSGSDTYVVGSAGDVVTEGTSGIDEIRTSVTLAGALVANVENLRLMGTGDLNATGNGAGNILYANSGNNVLSGGAGTDTVSYEFGATAGVTASLAVSTAQATGGSGADRLVSIERLTGSEYADRLTGSTGNNVLTGLKGNDTLLGGTGQDTLAGGTGKDTLTGGGGQDKFDFNAALNATTNLDRITDFNPAADLMRLDEDIFAALAVGTLSGGAFDSGPNNTAGDAGDRIIYNETNGNLYYDPDGTGPDAATQFARLYSTQTGAPSIDESHFLIVA